jgi:hypothetical protein
MGKYMPGLKSPQEIVEMNRTRRQVEPIVRLPYIRSETNTCNGNGYRLWCLAWTWNRKKYSKILYKQILGNGDNGERCQ